MNEEFLFVDLSKLNNAVGVLAFEQECVRRRTDCDRNCAQCDLVLPDKMILDAYSCAIDVLQHIRDAVLARNPRPWTAYRSENS